MAMFKYIILFFCVFPCMFGHRYVKYADINKSYKFVNTPHLWSDAISYCEDEDATLALPYDKEEAEVMKNFFKTYDSESRYILIGFHDQIIEGYYYTISGRHLHNQYYDWAPGNPLGQDNENCGGFDRQGKLADVPCNVSAPFICQKDTDKLEYWDWNCLTNDKNYIYNTKNNHCYKVHNHAEGWHHGFLMCLYEGSQLTVINSRAEEEFILKIIDEPMRAGDNFGIVRDKVFIGYHNKFKQGDYRTVDGKHLSSAGYVRWSAESNQKPENRCGALKRDGISDWNCLSPEMFVCEKELPTRVTF